MVVNASNRLKILNWFEMHREGLDVLWIDQTLSTVMIAIQGPKAIEMCDGLFDLALDTDVRQLKYYYSIGTAYRRAPCVVSRTGYTGEDGLEIITSADMGSTLADDLISRGAVPCGLGARDTLRLEAAMPLYGHELSESIDPLQAGLAWAVKFDKGDFLGREELLETKELDEKKRVGLVLEGKRAAREGCTILQGNTPVGLVTSGSFAPTLQQSIAMAYVSIKASSPGTDLTVDIRGTPTPAKVVPLPFYKRKS
jgi:aminomethyltransferase